MEELIINCQTGEETRRKFTAAEVEQREAEIAKAELEGEEQERQEAKAAFIAAKYEAATALGLIASGELKIEDTGDIQQRLVQARKRWKSLQPVESEPKEL